MIFITGDTHRDFSRFSLENFPEQKEMTRDDYVIICGDFGGIWCGDERDEEVLGGLAKLPFTILFVSGNHENFDEFALYEPQLWHGGKVQIFSQNVIHLMRGQVYTIDKKKFFTMGGATSHDIADGILEHDAPDFEEKLRALLRMQGQFRVNHFSWWKEEMPSDSEYEEARKNLAACNWNVDYIITHCAPNSIVDIIGQGFYEHDRLTDFLEEILQKVQFTGWYLGHYHENRRIGNVTLLYEEIVPLTAKWFDQGEA